jgi:hypothetical protein
MANVMLEGFHSAEQRIQDVQDAMDTERIQEGADRRAAAVEEVRRRRAEAEAEAKRIEAEAKEEAERIHLEAKENARLEQSRVREEALRAANEAKERAAAEAAQIAEEARVRAQFEARERELRLEREDVERAERHRQEDATRATAIAPPKRKRKAQSEETINRRMEASRKTRENKKFKLDNYDTVVTERDALEAKLKRVVDLFRTWDEDRSGTVDKGEFFKAVQSLLAMDGEEAVDDEVIEADDEETVQGTD